MKFLFNLYLLSLSILFTACNPEAPSIPVDASFELSFERDGSTTVGAGETFYLVATKGSGEFKTVYEGSTGKVWGEAGALGTRIGVEDSIPLTYFTSGTYKVTLVATSSTEYGGDKNQDTLTKTITVVDNRNAFTLFNINSKDGFFTANDSILFYVADVTTDFNYKPIFTLSSAGAKAYVNGTEQTSNSSMQDFSNPVIYTVKSESGVEKNYIVKFHKVPSSDEKKVLTFGIKNGPKATVDEATHTITLDADYSTAVTSVSLDASSSMFSTLTVGTKKIGTLTKFNLTALGEIKVTAQNGTTQVYSFVLNYKDPIESFTFEGLVPAPVGIVDKAAKTVTVNVLTGTDITKLKSKWVGATGTVKIGSVVQVNGVTENDFTSPQAYTFYQGTTAGDEYTVTVIEK